MKHRIIIFTLILLSIFSSCAKKISIDTPPTNTDLIISSNPDTLIDLPFDAAIYEIKVLSFIDWQIVEKPDWVVLDTLNFRGMEKEIVIQISVLENSSEEKREAVIKLKNSAEKVAEIAISQQGQKNNIVIELSVNAENIPAVVDFTGGSYDISVICSKNWSIKNSLSWVSFQETEYKGSSSARKIQLKILLNKSMAREGEIIFKSEDKEIPIQIKQSAYNINSSPYELIFDKSLVPARSSILPNRKVTVDYPGSMFGFFQLSTDDDWVQIHYSYPTGGFITKEYPATLSFKDNPNSYNRTTNLYFKKQELVDGKLVFITCNVYQIEQQAATSFLEINTANRNFEAPSKGTFYEFEVTANEDFTIQGNPSWIRMEKGITTNKKTPIKIIVDKNLSSQRTANFALTLSSGALKFDFSVSQKAAFVQTYPFNLQYGIILKVKIKDDIQNDFSQTNGNTNWANCVIFRLPSDVEAFAEKINTKYGFVIDAPNPSKTVLTPPIFSNNKLTELGKPYAKIYVPNYNAQFSTFNMEVNIFHKNNTLNTYYRRISIDNIPIPARLTSEDILIYTIDISELESNTRFNYKVSYEIK